MSKHPQYKALAKAVKDRRVELQLTQEEAADLTRKIDVEILHSGNHRVRLGISRATWAGIEQADEVERRGHTLELLDAALRWPKGTARAHLLGLVLPDGPPSVSLDSITRGVDEVASRAETARTRAEVAALRAEVAEMAVRFEGLEQAVQRALQAVKRAV